MKKEWVVKGGVVGTHHFDRDGRSVDFRPAKIVAGRDFIRVEPPKGQDEVKGATLTPKRVVKEVAAVDYPRPGMQRLRKIFFAEFMGVEVSATLEWAGYEWYDPAAEAASKEAAQAELAAEAASIEEKRNFLRNFPKESFAGRATLGELAKLRAGQDVVADVCRRILTDACNEALNCPPFGNLAYFEISRRRESGELGEIKTLVLAYEGERREERKRAWLARSTE